MNAKQKAGQKGGRATLAKHGREHMQDIGARGAQATWTRYYLAPIGQYQYAMVERATGIIKTVKDG